MKAYEQLGKVAKCDFSKAFKLWCEAVGYTEAQGDFELFSMPPVIAIGILKMYL